MTLDDRILDLLLRWEELGEQGQPITPEQLCQDSPELLDEIKKRIQDLGRVSSLVSTVNETGGADSAPSPVDSKGTILQPGPSSIPATKTGLGMRYGQQVFYAAGGLGEVYKAQDAELGRQVALKRMKAHVGRSSESRRRFLREAEITGRLEHPGIVPVYGLVQDENGQPCYAMRFIEGESLKYAIQKFHDADKSRRDPGERSLAFRQLLNQFIGVCKTIAYAHSRGIIHRDIKPGNIMLGKYGETLVVDWGLARPFGRTETERSSGEETLMPPTEPGEGQTGMGRAVGTPTYMSPEQAAGRLDAMGPPSDIYSLGATLYTLLTSEPSVSGGNAYEIMQKVQQGDFRAPRKVKPNVPSALEAICQKAMALQPEERYRAALELAEEVELWLADEPVTAYREPWHVWIRRFTRRNRPIVASVAAAVLVTMLLGGGGWGWWLWKQELTARDVEPLLADAEEILRHPEKDPKQAQHLLDQAKARMAGGGSAELRGRLEARQRDLDMAKRLEEAWLRSATVVDGKFDFRGADRLYSEAFAELGSALSSGNSQEAAEAIRASPISQWLIMGSDHWAFCKDQIEKNGGSELRALADQADDDDWRHQLRAAIRPLNPEVLARLAQDEISLQRAPPDLVFLGILLRSTGNRAAAENWFRLAVERHPEDFWINFDLAVTLIDKGPSDSAEAMKYLQAARALRPENAAVLNMLGNASFDRKDYDRAIRNYDEAIRLDPKYAIAFYNRGLAWSAMKAYDRAIIDYDEAIRLDPKYAAAFNNRGIAWDAKKEYDRAIRDLDEAIRLDPKQALAFCNRGLAWRDKKEYDRAIGDYDQAIRLDPTDAKAFNYRGNAWRDKKEYDRAIGDYDEAIRLDPNNTMAFQNRARAWFEKKEYDRAIRDYTEAIRLDPKDAKAFYNRGIAWVEKKEYDRAICDFDEAIRLDPNNAMAFYSRGIARREKKEYDRAIRDYDEAIRLDPNYAGAFNNRGNLWVEKKEYDRAIRDYDEVIRLDPKFATAFYNRGNAWVDKKDYDRAIRDYDEAIRLDPKFAKAFHNRGLTFGIQNKMAEAEADFKEAVQIAPTFVEARIDLGSALAMQGRFFEAREVFRSCLDFVPEGAPLRKGILQNIQVCERLIGVDEKLSGVLKDDVRPGDPGEWVELAQHCQLYRKQYAATARCFAEAFEAKPEFAQDLKAGHRYKAACAAALAGCGQGKDADKLDDKDLVRLRNQARAWLRAELEAWSKLAGQSKADARTAAVQALRHWQTDSDFAGVRNKEALEKMPEKESEAWTLLWRDVQSILDAVAASK